MVDRLDQHFGPQTLVGRMIRLPLKALPRTAAVPVLTSHLRGARWVVGAGVSRMWMGRYESRKADLVAAALGDGDVFFDVGAHAGYYTLIGARRVGHHGKVVAVDPNPRNLRYLRQHVTLNGCRNVEIVAAAASDADGELLMDVSSDPFLGHLSQTGSLAVRSVCLDTLVVEHGLPTPTCMKIDVEGAESRVLAGATRILMTSRPVVFLAIHGIEQRSICGELLAEAGYGIEVIEETPQGMDEWLCRGTS